LRQEVAAAIADLARSPGRHRLFYENFGWCGLALDAGNVSVFVDGRADPFPLEVWNQYDTVLHVRPQWRSIVLRYDVDAMLVRRDGSLDRAAQRNGWRVAREGPIRLLVRASKRYRDAEASRPFGT